MNGPIKHITGIPPLFSSVFITEGFALAKLY